MGKDRKGLTLYREEQKRPQLSEHLLSDKHLCASFVLGLNPIFPWSPTFLVIYTGNVEVIFLLLFSSQLFYQLFFILSIKSGLLFFSPLNRAVLSMTISRITSNGILNSDTQLSYKPSKVNS